MRPLRLTLATLAERVRMQSAWLPGCCATAATGTAGGRLKEG